MKDKKLSLKNEDGLVEGVIVLVIALIIASFYGYPPQTIFVEFIAPVLLFLWGIVVIIVETVVLVISTVIRAVQGSVTFFGNLFN